MEEKDLLAIAKGVVSSKQIENKELYWNRIPENRRDAERKRKLARRCLHKVVKYRLMNKPLPEKMEDANVLKKMIEKQLNPNLGLTWDTFTWKWDIHPRDHTKIILKEKWIVEGGGFDPEMGSHSPTAFTKEASDMS